MLLPLANFNLYRFPVIKHSYEYIILSVRSVGLSSDLSKLRMVLETPPELSAGSEVRVVPCGLSS